MEFLPDAKPDQHVSPMTVALHVTMTCLDVNNRHMLCQMGDVNVRLLVKGILAKVLKATIVFSLPCLVQFIYMTADIRQSG